MNIEQEDKGGTMALSKISQKRQVVIPETVFQQMGAEIGDYVEFVQRENDVVIKVKKLVDARSLEAGVLQPASFNNLKPTVPPPQTREDRLAMLKALAGNATDDSEDINVELIKAHQTSSDRVVEFD
jgi:bifunctional DNA-binding transcriptional regulator/antitoxin component of YhaV-PrlF toxin-antitoxin module